MVRDREANEKAVEDANSAREGDAADGTTMDVGETLGAVSSPSYAGDAEVSSVRSPSSFSGGTSTDRDLTVPDATAKDGMATPTADADANVTIIDRTASSFLRTPAAFRESAADDSDADADADADDWSSSSAGQVIPILSAADVEQKNATHSAAEEASSTTVHIIKNGRTGTATFANGIIFADDIEFTSEAPPHLTRQQTKPASTNETWWHGTTAKPPRRGCPPVLSSFRRE